MPRRKFPKTRWCVECGWPIPRTRKPDGHLESAVDYNNKRYCGKVCQRASVPAIQEARRRVSAIVGIMKSNRYGTNVPELEERFEVCQRTAFRDMRVIEAAAEVLDELGHPMGLVVDRGRKPEVTVWRIQ